VSEGVSEKTTVVLLRLRHQLSTQKGARNSTLLVEEATALAWTGSSQATLVEGSDALGLLVPPPAADPPVHVRERTVAHALTQLESRLRLLDQFAERRALALLADHRRVREAADARGSYSVKALLPADVMGLFVLLPRVS
jgi:hypothetical protein